MPKKTLPDRECFVCRVPDNRNAKHVITFQRQDHLLGRPQTINVAVFRCIRCQTRTQERFDPAAVESDVPLA